MDQSPQNHLHFKNLIFTANLHTPHKYSHDPRPEYDCLITMLVLFTHRRDRFHDGRRRAQRGDPVSKTARHEHDEISTFHGDGGAESQSGPSWCAHVLRLSSRCPVFLHESLHHQKVDWTHRWAESEGPMIGASSHRRTSPHSHRLARHRATDRSN